MHFKVLDVGPRALIGAFVLFLSACNAPDSEPLPPHSFAFAVFGDGPYFEREEDEFNGVIREVNEADLEWFLHVGDIQWGRCSDENYRQRFEWLNEISHPVIYTPGDNEWTDCHESGNGDYDPLDRLASLRRIFFSNPTQSLGGRRIPLVTQAADSSFSEFVENRRWTHAGLVFATIHVVGSWNGLKSFEERTADHDAEVQTRMDAAISWLADTFVIARRDSSESVFIAIHANIGFLPDFRSWEAFEEFLPQLKSHVGAFEGNVYLIHGDTHVFNVDQPLLDDTGQPYSNFTRIETFGSPDIGWLRVVVDTLQGRVTNVEPRLSKGWL